MIFLFFILTLSFAKVETITFNSTVLGKETYFNVLYPDTYGQKDLLYPVLYLLHGMFQTGHCFLEHGLEDVYSDLLSKQETKDMIIIMPYVEDSNYVDNYNGTMKYETYFHQELMPKVDEMFNINRDKIALAGFSMGGWGAMYYMSKYPEKFIAAQGMTPALWPENYLDEIDWNSRTAHIDKVVLECFNNTEYFNQHCPQLVIRNSTRGIYENKHFRLAVGTDDYYFHNNHLFHFELNNKDIHHQFIVRRGGHKWVFWEYEIPLMLKWLNDIF